MGWADLPTWLVAGAGGTSAAATLYLLVLAVAAFAGRSVRPPSPRTSRLSVVVPAHDEETLIARCIASLQEQTYPADRVRIVVVADNCTDGTAAIAAAMGAEVLVRDRPDLRGKGHALRFAMDHLLAGASPPDAVVVVDADSVADGALLATLEARMAAGADVVQAEYLVLADGRTSSELRAAAFLLFHRTRFAGRAALGMGCTLVGNGMLLRRSVLEAVPWSAFSSAEDLEYSMILRLAGIVPRFAAGAVVAGPASTGGRAGRIQRERWEGGRFWVVRAYLGRLLGQALRRGRPSLLDAAVDLAVPPLGLLVLGTAAGAAASAGLVRAGAVHPWAVVPWLAALLGVAAYVLVGLRAARAPRSAYLALLRAPFFLLAKVGTYARLSRGLRADRWVRTDRGDDRHRGGRVDVGGIGVDAVDSAAALDRMMAAVADHRFLQVCTVNLHFLATARRQPAVRDVLAESGLNVADGAPVVWLTRLLGRRVPERVSGSDLVPSLMNAAAASGARVFLLGGVGGTAADAAATLVARHPSLAIAGTLEPPLGTLESMDGAVVERINEARPDILLVGLGHPKQELWIHANRTRLDVSVAIGVGCTLDLIAGRASRAPLWMRTHGLEWLHRLCHEPRRLFWRYASCAASLLFVLLPLSLLQRAGGTRLGAPRPPDLQVLGRAQRPSRAVLGPPPGGVGARSMSSVAVVERTESAAAALH